MLKNHLTIAFRTLTRNPVFSLINILGLSIGLACAFLIYFWVIGERGMDGFHKNEDRLYQILMRSSENGTIRVHDGTQGPLAEALEKDLPEVESAVTVMDLHQEGMAITFLQGEQNLKAEGLFASPNYFQVFSFPLLRGSADQILTGKDALVVSENFALKMFGSLERAIDQSLEYSLFGKDQKGTIRGIFQNPPANSTLRFDFVATKQKLLEDIWPNGKEWYNTGPNTYVLLKEGVKAAEFDQKIERFVDSYDEANHFSLFTQKFSEKYLHGNFTDGVPSGGRITYVRLFSLVALLVLLIACINFMNLSTARVSRRFKEIGIKKTVGGTRKALFFQFMTESLFLTFLSLLLAAGLVILLLPAFEYITGKSVSFELRVEHLIFLLLITAGTGLLAGSYPSFYLSGFRPLATLKGQFRKGAGELFARRGLVIFQFMASLILIIAVLVINKQVNYSLSKPVGYAKENLVYFSLEGKVYDEPGYLLDEIRGMQGVAQAGTISESLISEDGGSSTYGISWPGKKDGEEIDFMLRRVGFDLVETMKIDMAAGAFFSKDIGSPESYLIFNETAVRLMGLNDPVGTRVNLWGEDKTILGVMKDFHTASLMEPIAPLAFQYSPGKMDLAMVRLNGVNQAQTIDAIRTLYETSNPQYNFNFGFMDQAYEAQYLTEKRILRLSRYFAYLVIFISCLGLFGLSAFNTALRDREIGIRKVLGSSVFGILKLLSLDFIWLIIAAIALSVPLAWYLMRLWLTQFAYRVEPGYGIFLAAAGITIVISLATVSIHAVRAALADPVKSLAKE